MSEAAARFIADTMGDETLARRFAELVGDRSFPEAVGDIVVFARDHGYDLDREALVSVKARLDRQAAAPRRPASESPAGKALSDGELSDGESSDGELSDAELEPLSGGVFGWLQHQNRNATLGPNRDPGDPRTDPGNRAFWLGF